MPKSKSEQTSKRVASEAGRILRDPRSTKRQRSVAASDLTQARDRAKRGKK